MNDRLSPQVHDSVEDTPATSLVRMILAAKLMPNERIDRLLGNPIYTQYLSDIVGSAVENIMNFSDIVEGMESHIASSDIIVESTPVTIGLDEESGEMLRVHINEVFKGALHHVYQVKEIVGAWGEGLGAFGMWDYTISTVDGKPNITISFTDEQLVHLKSEKFNWAYLVCSKAEEYLENNYSWKSNGMDHQSHDDFSQYTFDWANQKNGMVYQINIIMPYDMSITAEIHKTSLAGVVIPTVNESFSTVPAETTTIKIPDTSKVVTSAPVNENSVINNSNTGASRSVEFKAPEGLGEFLLKRLKGTVLDTPWQIRLSTVIRMWNKEHPDNAIHNYDAIKKKDLVYPAGKLWKDEYGITTRETACRIFGLPEGTLGVTKRAPAETKKAPSIPIISNVSESLIGEPELLIPRLGMKGTGYGTTLAVHGAARTDTPPITPGQPVLANKNTSKPTQSPHQADPGKAEKIQQLNMILERINGGFQAALKHLSKSGKQFNPWSGIGEIGTFSWERIQEPGKPLTVSISFTDAQKGWRNGEIDIWGHLVTKAAKTYLESNYKFGWDNQLYAYRFTNEAGVRVYIRMPYTVDAISSKRQQDVPDITLSNEGNIDANAAMKGFQDIFSSYLQGIYSEVQVHESQGKGGIKINGTSIPVVKDSFKMDLEHGYMVTKKESNKTITIYPGNVVQSILDFMKREALIKSFLIQSRYEETGGGFRGENDESITILNNGGAPIITFEWYGWTINFHTKKNDGIEA